MVGGSSSLAAASPDCPRRSLDSLNAADPVHVGAVEWISLDRWHADRVVIIGDAAHAAPPHMGE